MAFKAAGHKGYENYANIHFKHGLTNIAAGFFEAIPLVGLVLLVVRAAKDRSPISYGNEGAQAREDIGFKFSAYPSLKERDFYFDNCSKEDSERLQAQYQQLRQNHPTTRCSELASQVVRAHNPPPY